MRTLLASRVTSAVGAVACVATLSIVMSIAVVGGSAATAAAADDVVTCFDATLARQKTEVDTNLVVPQFDSSLGTLLDVTYRCDRLGN